MDKITGAEAAALTLYKTSITSCLDLVCTNLNFSSFLIIRVAATGIW